MAYQLTDGIDLTAINGVGVGLLLNLIAEVGLDMSKFPTAKHFASWLCLCPNTKISGNKVLSSKTRTNKTNRLAYAFRQAANSVGNLKEENPLTHFFKRLAYKHGRKTAIVATARKLSVIVYYMLKYKKIYDPMPSDEYLKQVRENKLKYLKKTIKKLGITANELALN